MTSFWDYILVTCMIMYLSSFMLFVDSLKHIVEKSEFSEGIQNGYPHLNEVFIAFNLINTIFLIIPLYLTADREWCIDKYGNVWFYFETLTIYRLVQICIILIVLLLFLICMLIKKYRK